MAYRRRSRFYGIPAPAYPALRTRPSRPKKIRPARGCAGRLGKRIRGSIRPPARASRNEDHAAPRLVPERNGAQRKLSQKKTRAHGAQLRMYLQPPSATGRRGIFLWGGPGGRQGMDMVDAMLPGNHRSGAEGRSTNFRPRGVVAMPAAFRTQTAAFELMLHIRTANTIVAASSL